MSDEASTIIRHESGLDVMAQNAEQEHDQLQVEGSTASFF
jgi:hypothetical protein